MTPRPPRSTPFLHDALPIWQVGARLNLLRNRDTIKLRDVALRHEHRDHTLVDIHRPRQPHADAIDAQSVGTGARMEDRKSTRLNSSHPSISYVVFCLTNKII